MTYKEFFELAENKGINKIQITETTTKKLEINYIDENLEKYNIAEQVEYFIKAEKNKKTEKVKTNYIDESILDLLIMKLKETDSSYEDEYITNKKVCAIIQIAE